MLSVNLKEFTAFNHRQLEGKIISQIRAIKKPADYLKLLSLFYVFFGALEIQVKKHLHKGFLPDGKERRKTALLLEDFDQLGVKNVMLPGNKTAIFIKAHLQAIGALYVMEGSTLGGQAISKMIAKQLSSDTGMRFFNGYGLQTATMWESFKNTIDKKNFEQADEKIIIDAANETFKKFSNYFDAQQVTV